ncbi:hypothetical protein CYMTET_43379, partial [Cymbomonas tetramitiformis]
MFAPLPSTPFGARSASLTAGTTPTANRFSEVAASTASVDLVANLPTPVQHAALIQGTAGGFDSASGRAWFACREAAAWSLYLWEVVESPEEPGFTKLTLPASFTAAPTYVAFVPSARMSVVACNREGALCYWADLSNPHTDLSRRAVVLCHPCPPRSGPRECGVTPSPVSPWAFGSEPGRRGAMSFLPFPDLFSHTILQAHLGSVFNGTGPTTVTAFVSTIGAGDALALAGGSDGSVWRIVCGDMQKPRGVATGVHVGLQGYASTPGRVLGVLGSAIGYLRSQPSAS